MNNFESIESKNMNYYESIADNNNQNLFTPSYICEIDSPFKVDIKRIITGN